MPARQCFVKASVLGEGTRKVTTVSEWESRKLVGESDILDHVFQARTPDEIDAW